MLVWFRNVAVCNWGNFFNRGFSLIQCIGCILWRALILQLQIEKLHICIISILSTPTSAVVSCSMTYLQLHVWITLVERSVIKSVGMVWIQHFKFDSPSKYRRITSTQLGFLSCRLNTKTMCTKWSINQLLVPNISAAILCRIYNGSRNLKWSVLLMHIVWYWSYPSVSAVYSLEYRNHCLGFLQNISTI